MRELICIVCPKGCHLRVDEGADYAVIGSGCPRGAEYGRRELLSPTRVLTSTVRCVGGTYPRCPVKTDRPIPKGLIAEAMAVLDAVTLTAPVRLGQTVAQVGGTEARFVTTRAMPSMTGGD